MTRSSQEHIAAWRQRADDRLEGVQKLAEKMENLKVGAVNDENTVKVTVDATGALIDLKLHPKVTKETAADIAAEIMATVKKARLSVSEGAAMILERTVGTETETGKAVLGSFHKRLGKPDDAGGDRP